MNLDKTKFDFEDFVKAYFQYHNIDNIINELISDFFHFFELVEYKNGFFIINKVRFFEYEKTNKFYHNNIEIKYDEYYYDSIDNSYMDDIKFSIHLMMLDDYQYYNEFLKEKTFVEYDIYVCGITKYTLLSTFDFKDLSFHKLDIILNIPACFYEENICINIEDIKNIIKNELTLYYEDILNPVYQDNIDEYNKVSHVIEKLMYIMYFFSNEINRTEYKLIRELKELNANEDNFKTIFPITKIGKKYFNAVDKMETIFNDDTIQWNTIRETMQANNLFYGDNIVRSTKDNDIFQTELYNFIIDMKYCCDETISSYSEKIPYERYSEKQPLWKISLDRPEKTTKNIEYDI